jgi:signal peptidase I
MKKKRKKGFTLVYVIAGLIVLYIVANLTGMLKLFKIPTTSSRPTLEVGDRILVSNIVSPERFDLIVFKYYDSMMQEKVHHVFRLCGMPGDTVEIKNGELYVNSQFPGKKFDICLPYAVSVDHVQKITELAELEEDELEFPAGPDKPVVILSNADCDILRKNNIGFERWVVNRDQKNEYIKTRYGRDWNEDHFGPMVIPKDHYFALGDNRNRAMDSRYTGLIPISEFYGTVILK